MSGEGQIVEADGGKQSQEPSETTAGAVVSSRRAKHPCIVNEATGRPYTRHRYKQENLRVTEYTRMAPMPWQGTGEHDVAATAFAFELVCERCGHEVPCAY